MRQLCCVILAAALPVLARGQAALPPVRQLGEPVAVSPREFKGVTFLRMLPAGYLLANDASARRLLLIDTTLRNIVVIADTNVASANQYGVRPGGLLAFRGDSSLFVELATPSMYVLDPRGVVARSMAVPVPRNANALSQLSIGGWPAVDPRGRFVYRGSAPRNEGPVLKQGEILPWTLPDTSSILRVDSTRQEQVLAWFHSLRIAGVREGLGEGRSVFYISNDPFPVVEDFGVLSDGTIVILRGDYHLELIDMDGKHTASGRIPYPWERLSDEGKVAAIDSLRRLQAARVPASNNGTGTSGSGIGTGGGGQAVGPPREKSAAATEYEYVKPSTLPDYRPAFGSGALRVDNQDRLWIKTLQPARAGRAIYDVVTRDGALVDRIDLPSDRVILGFDAISVYVTAREGPVSWIERIKRQ